MGERDLAGLGDSLASPGEDDDDEAEQPTESEPEEPREETMTEPASQTEEQSEKEVSGDTTTSTSTQTQQSTDQSTGANEDSRPSQCQEITRDGTQCDHDAQTGSSYCKKHQPDKFGNRPGEFQRKQWNLLPEVVDGLFADSVMSESLYIDVQKEVGESFQKKSIENKMGEFLLEHRDEFIDFVSREYSEQQ